MDIVQSLAGVGLPTTWEAFVGLCIAIWYSMPFRLFCLLLFVLCTIWVIAKIYSGDLQNAERGPVAIRRHSATSIPSDTIIVPRTLVPLSMDGVQARVTFMYVYDGHRGKRQHAKLFTRNMQLSVSASNLRALVDMAKGNEVPDVGTEEVFWPILDIETDTPTQGYPTCDRAQEHARVCRILERWSGDDALQLISLSEPVMDDVRQAREDFIEQRVSNLRASKSKNLLDRIRHSGAAAKRPGAVGNYYLKFQFSNDPAFVLMKHPDRDVRMTAWLTVLTSVFALAMELLPLEATPPAGVAGAAAAPIDRATQDATARSSPRVRPPVRP
ncbi:MAG TPA: hypothetical protein VEA80_17395 [Vitreimonas sp.]|uniref:hypothetical protein n=1 Tax=Vitreimonas sp. TaxID=3069702 RepID=UPI002D36E7D5|nr:hypothetical protein [Vitreimonas sp.]HYD89257.1 hypothetical protein [Vitreimonas sp.]